MLLYLFRKLQNNRSHILFIKEGDDETVLLQTETSDENGLYLEMTNVIEKEEISPLVNVNIKKIITSVNWVMHKFNLFLFIIVMSILKAKIICFDKNKLI